MPSPDPFERIYSSPLGPPVAPAVAGDLSAAGVMQSGLDRVQQPRSNEEGWYSYDEGPAVEVARSSDGKMIKVVAHSTAGIPDTFPQIVKVVVGDLSLTLDANGLVVEDADSGNTFTVSPAGVVTLLNGSTGKILTVDPDLITADMDVTEWDVANSGSPGKALFLSSAPYAP